MQVLDKEWLSWDLEAGGEEKGVQLREEGMLAAARAELEIHKPGCAALKESAENFGFVKL